MIYSLTGKISRIDDNTLVVDTGSMAFEVVCSTYTVFELSADQETKTILTYLQVREDAMCLYGFKDKREKQMFNELILVSGVGPKMAVTILSGLPVDHLIKAITTSDIKRLTSIKGLGKKTAERIVLELGNKFGVESGLESLLAGEISVPTQVVSSSLKKEIEEAVDVLVSTGLQKSQAIEIAKKNYVDGMTSEQLVVNCFRNLK